MRDLRDCAFGSVSVVDEGWLRYRPTEDLQHFGVGAVKPLRRLRCPSLPCAHRGRADLAWRPFAYCKSDFPKRQAGAES
jgi:hypothetical protein